MSERVLGGRYRLDEQIGHGGAAVVWRGLDQRLDRPVAVKMLHATTGDPAAAARFDREARTVARLMHPNIVAVFDVGTDGGTPYLVMEFVDGHTLADRLADGPLPVAEAVDIAVQVCGALGAAHAAGVVHRDVKPGNILIDRTGTVKVCDFGIAHLEHTQADLTGPNTAMGTAHYLAPEQATNDPLGPRTDLYALGCMMHAMLTGGPPFTAGTPIQVIWKHVHDAPPAVRDTRPDVPPGLAELVGRMLAKRAGDRPDGAEAVRDALRRLPVPAGAALPGVAAPPAGAGRHGRPAAGDAPPAPWVARATVAPDPNPTRLMPVADTHAPPAAGARWGRPSRWRPGRAGLAAILAVVLVITVLGAIALLNRDPGSGGSTVGGGNPGGSGSTTPASTSAAPEPPQSHSSSPADPVDAVVAAVAEQGRAGHLSAKQLRELARALEDIQEKLAKGDTGKAAEKVAELRGKLDDWRREDKIDEAGYGAISGELDRLAASLPAHDGGDGGDGD